MEGGAVRHKFARTHPPFKMAAVAKNRNFFNQLSIAALV
jgi:hypothetical protein